MLSKVVSVMGWVLFVMAGFSFCISFLSESPEGVDNLIFAGVAFGIGGALFSYIAGLLRVLRDGDDTNG